jgi:hypothetical protein
MNGGNHDGCCGGWCVWWGGAAVTAREGGSVMEELCEWIILVLFEIMLMIFNTTGERYKGVINGLHVVALLLIVTTQLG